MLSSVKPPFLAAIFSTLNKTVKSFLMGIVAAEYVLGWVPRGTHHWNKFIRPADLARAIRKAGGKESAVRGLCFDPLKNDFYVSETDIDVNYMLIAEKN